MRINSKPCSVPNCEKPLVALGYCSKHRYRFKKYGDPLKTKHEPPDGDGYMQGGYPGRQINGVRKFNHVRIVEHALGKELGPNVVIHHWNEDKTDNRHENLLVCQDRAYHNLIHARMAAYDACGNSNWRRCRHCGNYDDPTNLRVYQRENTTSYWHLECARLSAKQRRATK